MVGTRTDGDLTGMGNTRKFRATPSRPAAVLLSSTLQRGDEKIYIFPGLEQSSTRVACFILCAFSLAIVFRLKMSSSLEYPRYVTINIVLLREYTRRLTRLPPSLSLSLRSKVSIHTWSSHFMNCPVNRHLIAGRSAKKVNDGGQLNEIFVSINPTRYHYY